MKNLNEIKQQADFRIIGCLDKYELSKNENIKLKGRGITERDNYYLVTEKALEKIEEKYNVVSDF